MNGALATFPTNTQRPSFQVVLLFCQNHLPPLKTSLIGHHKTRCHTAEKIQLMIFIFKSKTKPWKLPNKELQSEQLSRTSSEITLKTKPLMSGASVIFPTSTRKRFSLVALLFYQSPQHQLRISLTGLPRMRCHTRERILLMTFIFKPKTQMRLVLRMLDYKLLKCKLKWIELSLMLMPRELNNKLIMNKTSKMMILKLNSKV